VAAQYSITKTVQRQCSTDLMEAASMFGRIDSDGSTPLVLIPDYRFCCNFVIRIPSGVYAIVTRFGEDQGEWAAGLRYAPPWYRVAFLVTRQSCTYNYPVSYCPTKDNVMVKVDITLVFRIDKAQDFVYRLGATKFDDMLQGVAEEAIRSTVRSTDHTSIYEIRGSTTREHLLDVLNKKFKTFGVIFTDASITSVELPPDLATTLQRATTYDAQMREQIRKQEYSLKVLNDNNDLALNELNLKNDRMEAEQNSKKDRIIIDLDKKKFESEQKKNFMSIEGHQNAAVLKTEAESALQAQKLNTEAKIAALVQRAKGTAQARMTEANQWAETEVTKYTGQLTLSKNRAQSLTFEADAESRAAEELKERRAYDLQTSALEALSYLAQKGKIVISGKEGDKIISALTSGSTGLLLDKKK